jgi:hypothetical protein
MSIIKFINNKPYNNGDGATNFDIDEKAKKLKLNNYRGSYMRDEFKKIKPLNQECGILNLDLAKNEGQHWTCWWKNGKEKYYFDSFGIIPPKELINYLKANNDLEYSTFQIQQFNDANCGEWCLYILSELNKGNDYEDIILKIIDEKTY